MHLLPTDIIVRRYKQEHSLWISQRLLITQCGVSEEYLWKKARPTFKKTTKGYKYKDYLPYTGAAWRWARVGGKFYYDYDCIPDRAPTHYRSALGSKDALLQAAQQYRRAQQAQTITTIKQQLRQRVANLVSNTDAHYYRYHSAIGYTAEQAQQLATARAWCRFILQQLQNHRYRSLGISTKKDFYQLCTDILLPLKLQGFNISSAKYLRNKIAAYAAEPDLQAQLNFFISGKFGNTNALVVGKYKLYNEETGQVYDYDIHQAIIYNLYMNPGKASKEYMFKLWDQYYKHDIIAFGEQPVAYRTFIHHCRRYNNEILATKARHGSEWYKKNMLTYVAAEPLQYAHSLYAGDGSGTLAYQYRDSDGKLKARNLYILLISDIASRYVAGWAPAPEGSSSEDPGMTLEALRMAIDNSERKTMFEFVSDNHGSFTQGSIKKTLNMAFNRVRTIEKGNSQANPAETQFRLIKRSMKGIFNMIATSRDGGIETKGNPDHITTKDLPTYADALVQVHQCIKRWNNTPLRDGSTPQERFKGNKHPDCKPIEAQRLRYIYGKHTKVHLGYMRGYINVHTSTGHYNTTKYQYEIPDYGGAGTELIAKYTGYAKNPEVKVVWDEDMADLYCPKGSFILSCPRVVKAAQSHAEGSDEKATALEAQMERKNRQMRYADEMENVLKEIADELNYEHAMALGGNKESYNNTIEEHASTRINESARHRVDRDFKNSGWADKN
ncbi:MAG: hypothetical protein RQ756_01860 [Flavobacteriaceae bacterium]|nr:hypothetical protein [Flavobacteriaceae bacterium]